jgi:hypothetical protein
MVSVSMEELIEANDRLRSLIYTLDNLSIADELPGPEPSAVTSLGRRIASSSIPPTFIRFNTESGPLEPLPNQFQVPFPTLENFKGSLLNSKISANRLIAASRPQNRSTSITHQPYSQPLKPPESFQEDQHTRPIECEIKLSAEDDEYADDF